MTYAPKHSDGSCDNILNVDQTSLFSLFLKLKLLIKFFLEIIADFKKSIFFVSVNSRYFFLYFFLITHLSTGYVLSTLDEYLILLD